MQEASFSTSRGGMIKLYTKKKKERTLLDRHFSTFRQSLEDAAVQQQNDVKWLI